MFLIKSININNTDKEAKIVNSFKTIEKAIAFCKNENYKNHISDSSEHFYYEFDKGELLEIQKEMQLLTN